MTYILKVTNYIQLTTPIMSKGVVCVRIFVNHYMLDALVMHFYKIVSYWKYLLIKKGYVVSLYQSPSQTPDKSDSFINNLEKLIIDMYI